MKNPYEKGGIIASVVILATVLVVGLVMSSPCEYLDICKGYGGGGGGSSNYSIESPKVEDCKQTSNDLQDLYDCVNKP